MDMARGLLVAGLEAAEAAGLPPLKAWLLARFTMWVAPAGLLVVLMEAEVGTTKASDIELVCITLGRP